jgi:uncharacterized protein
MKFWDSSAILPLCVKEINSDHMEQILSLDGDMVVWWATRNECISALTRRYREGTFSGRARTQATSIVIALAGVWSEIQPMEALRLHAERLLMVHPLRAADAMQLAAALIWAEDTPRGLEFICLDQHLAEAAGREGFTVLPISDLP